MPDSLNDLFGRLRDALDPMPWRDTLELDLTEDEIIADLGFGRDDRDERAH